MKKVVFIFLLSLAFNRGEVVNSLRTIANQNRTFISTSVTLQANGSQVGSALAENLQQQINQKIQLIQNLKQKLSSLH